MPPLRSPTDHAPQAPLWLLGFQFLSLLFSLVALPTSMWSSASPPSLLGLSILLVLANPLLVACTHLTRVDCLYCLNFSALFLACLTAVIFALTGSSCHTSSCRIGRTLMLFLALWQVLVNVARLVHYLCLRRKTPVPCVGQGIHPLLFEEQQPV